MPEDYRAFLTEVGNGGAGPHYGVKTLSGAAQYSNLAVPFPWSSEVVLLTDADFHLWDKFPGVLVIAERGCGYTDMLVVNGGAYGQIWSDFVAASGTLTPTNSNFMAWYVEWGNRCIATIKREPLIDKIRVGMTVDDVRDILGTDMQLWAGQTELPDSPSYYIGFTNTNASFSIGEDHRVQKINKMNQV